jgi:hypothetical protein
MFKRWYDLHIEWPAPLTRDAVPVRDAEGVAARILAALSAAGIVAHDLSHGAWELWDRAEHQASGIFAWGQALRVDDIWAAVMAAREALTALDAPPETGFMVRGRNGQIVRTYLLHPAQGCDEWYDLDQVERLAGWPADYVRG